jgi:ubiquitin-protein ligase
MQMSIRNRRIDVEWELLEDLVEANPSVFASIVHVRDEFHIAMRESPAWVSRESERQVETEHSLRYVFPRYYPSLPLEGYFVRPVLHVNVDPVTGFVCLWKNYRPGQTIVDAILITRAVMACKAANWDTTHRMQQNIFIDSAENCALPMPPLTVPANCRPLLSHQRRRRRLSTEFYDNASQESNLAFSDTE